MNRLRRAMIFAAGIVVALVSVYIFNITTVGYLKDDGYIVTGNEVYALLNGSKSLEEQNASNLVPVAYNDKLYKRAGALLVGNDRTRINTAFPMFINGGAAIMCFDDQLSLITSDFARLPSYPDLYLSDGISFNADGQRADPDTFIFLEMKNGLYLNAKSMTVTTVYGETHIPANSVINFTAKSMRYGVLQTGAFVVEELDVMTRAKVTVNDQEYDYEELLKLLGKYRDRKPGLPGTTQTTATATPLPEEPPLPEETAVSENTPEEHGGSTDPLGTQNPQNPQGTDPSDSDGQETGMTPQPLEPSEPQAPERPDRPSASPAPAQTPAPDSSDGQIEPGTDNAGSEAGTEGGSSGGTSGSSGVKPVKKPKIQIPEVTCSGFTPWVYTLNGSISIKDPELRIYKGVRFTVYKSGKIYLRLTFTAGGSIYLATLPPDTDLEVEGTFQYENLAGNRENVTFFPRTPYHTLPIAGNINPVNVTYDNSGAEIYPTQISIGGMSFNLDPTGIVKNNAISYISRLNVSVTEQGTASTSKMTAPAAVLKALKESKPAVWISPPSFKSNRLYDFALTLEDRFGNLLPQVDETRARGTVNTSKQPPQAGVKITANAVGRLGLEVTITNPDAIAFEGDQAFLTIKDSQNLPVLCSGTYSNNTPFSMKYIPLGTHVTSLTINNLPAGAGYTAEVTAAFDSNNGKGLVADQVIGRTPFFTVPISSLGFTNYTVEFSQITDSSARMTSVLNSQTSPQLLPLLSKIELSVETGNQEIFHYALTKEVLSQLDASDADGNGEILLAEADLAGKKPRISLKATQVSHFDNNAWYALLSGADADPSKRNPASIIVTYPEHSLTPATNYTFSIKTSARQGDVDNDVSSPSARYFMRTLKHEPWVQISNFFVTETFVEFYDLHLFDENTSIIGGKVSARLHTVNPDGSRGAFVASQNITSGYDYALVKFNSLKPQTRYMLIFVADSYNNGFDNSTYKINYELQTRFVFSTSNAVSGSLSLSALNYENGGAANPDELFNSATMTFGKYLTAANAETLNVSYGFSDYIPVDRTKSYYKDNGTGNNTEAIINFYRADRSFISGKVVAGIVNPADFPAGTAFIRFNANISGRWAGMVSFREYTPNSLGPELYNKDLTTVGSFHNGGPTLSANASYAVSSYIPVSPGAEYMRQGTGASWLTFFDANKKVVAMVQSNGAAPALVRAPEKAKYVRLDLNKNNLAAVSFRQYGTTPQNNAYRAKLQAQITDANNELAGVTYIVRGYKASISDNPSYVPVGNDYTAVITADGAGVTEDVSQYIQRAVDANSSYKFELILRLSASREVLLSTLEFTTQGPITILNSSRDLFKIQSNPYGRFIVTADTTYAELANSVLWSASVPFMGVLDFQGHTYTSNTQYLINTVGQTGIIRNVVLDITYNVATYTTDRYALVYTNYGRISDIYINYKTTHVLDYNSGIWAGCGLMYYNMSSGVLENFVINLRNDYLIGYWSSAGVRYNHGTVRNGYICSYNDKIFKAIRNYSVAARSYLGGLVAYNSPSGRIQNVFSLVDFEIYKETEAETSHASAGILAGYNYGTMLNCFVTGDRRVYEPELAAGLPAGLNTVQSAANGPAVGVTAGKYDSRNIFYFSENIPYQGAYHSKIGLPALFDPEWYQSSIGTQNQFNIMDPVSQGFYPQVKMSAVMMSNQEFIPLPELIPAAAPRIVASTVTKQTETYALADITLENPQQLRIKSIKLHNLECEIISQDLEYNNVYRVKVRLTSPMTFVSKYEITGITYSFYGYDYTVNLGTAQSGHYYIDAEFYRSIYTVNDWRNFINGDPTQNYRLKNDLNFLSYTYDYMNIGGTRYTFSGKLDGGIYDAEGNLTGIHKISGMIGGNYNYIIYNLTGTLKNLLIDDFLASSKQTGQAYVGFVRTANTGASIDNVHLNNTRILGYSYVGGLVGQASSATITNCSVRNSTFTSFENGISTLHMGAIVGYSNLTSVTNSYVYNVNLDASDIFLAGGVGGIAGRIDNANITNCYAHGKVINSGINTGGIVGQAVNNTEITGCYSTMDLIVIGEYAGGIAGRYTRADSVNNPFVQYNLSVGSIYTRSNDAVYFHRIGGTSIFDENGNVDERHRTNSAYAGQLINGEIPDPPRLDDAYMLVSHSDLEQEAGYTELVGFDNNAYDYSHAASGALPLLKSTQGTLLPYQTELFLPLETTAPIIIEQASEEGVGTYYVQFKVLHDQTQTVKSIAIDGLNITSQTPVALPDGTRYACSAVAVAPYDSYMLTVTLQDQDGKEAILLAKVDFGQIIFVNIANINDWQDFFGPGRNMQSAYANVNITGNIDFTGVVNPVLNVKVNRITGQVVGGVNPKIMNLTLTGPNASQEITGSLINDIVTTCTNLDFENIQYEYKRGTTQGNRVGLIGMSRKNIENVNFKNITLNAERVQYLGVVGSAAGTIRNVHLDNVRVNPTVVPLAVSYAGALTGNNTGLITNVTATNCYVRGQDYTGILVGYSQADSIVENCLVENATVDGRSYVGGMEGYSWLSRNNIVRGTQAAPTNITASGNNVGGMMGYSYTTNTNNLVEGLSVNALNSTNVGGLCGSIGNGWVTLDTARNITVTGKTAVGGLLGYGWIRDCKIEASTVNGVSGVGGVLGSASNTTSYTLTATHVTINGNDSVGGIIGTISGTVNHYDFIVRDCTISGTAGNGFFGDSVGGLMGTVIAGRLYSSYVYNTTVSGRNNIGGLFGTVLTVQANNCYAASTNVTSSGVNAGGIAGYATGSHTSGAVYTKFYDSFFYGNVTAQDYAAGILGLFEKGTVPTLSGQVAPELMLQEHYYNLLSMGNVTNQLNIHVSSWANKSGGVSPGTINNFRLYSGVTVSRPGLTLVNADSLPTGAANPAKMALSSDLANPVFYTGAVPANLGWNVNGWSTGGTILLDLYDVFASAGTGVTSTVNPVWLRAAKIPNLNGSYNVVITKESGPDTFASQTFPAVAFTDGVAQINIPGLIAGTYTLRFDVMVGAGETHSGKIVNYMVRAANQSAGMTLDTGGSGLYFTAPMTATVTPALAGSTYQWYRVNGTGTGNIAIPGATTDSLRIAGRGYYVCRVINGSRWSESPMIFMDTIGYMPYVKSALSGNPVLPFQEGFDGGGIPYSVTDSMYDGGIPVPNNPSNDLRLFKAFGFAMKALPAPLPVPVFYASGPDTLNIEFDASIPESPDGYEPCSAFIVAANGKDLLTQAIEKRVYTLRYDFETPLAITLFNGSFSQTYPINPSDVARSVMTWGKDYFYLNDVGIGSSKGQILGSFTHLSNGYAMERGGILHDLQDASIVRDHTEIALMETTPLFRFNHDGYVLDVYRGFTQSTNGSGTVSRDMQLVVKNGTLYAVQPDETIVQDGILIDRYLDNEIYALLGVNGKIGRLTGEIRSPKDFKNANIVQMSHTLGSDSPIVLMRYKDGSVYGFNYLSGERLDLTGVTSDMTLAEYMTDFFTPDPDLFPPVSAEYVRMTELKAELTVHPFDPEQYNPGDDDKEGTSGGKAGSSDGVRLDGFEAGVDSISSESYDVDLQGGNTTPGKDGASSSDENSPSSENDGALSDSGSDGVSGEDGAADSADTDGSGGGEGSDLGGEGLTGGTGSEDANSGVIAEEEGGLCPESASGSNDPAGSGDPAGLSGQESPYDPQEGSSEGQAPLGPDQGPGTIPEVQDTSSSGTNHGSPATTHQPAYEKPRQAHYVVAFNTKTMAYEVYDADALLNPDTKAPVSENEKLKKAKDPRITAGVGVVAKSAPASINALLVIILIAIAAVVLLLLALTKIKPHAGKKQGS